MTLIILLFWLLGVITIFLTSSSDTYPKENKKEQKTKRS